MQNVLRAEFFAKSTKVPISRTLSIIQSKGPQSLAPFGRVTILLNPELSTDQFYAAELLPIERIPCPVTAQNWVANPALKKQFRLH